MNSKKFIYLIIFVGIAVRLFLFAYFLPESKFFYDDDSRLYIQLAENMRLGNGYSWDTSSPFLPDAFRTPLYPLFLLGHRIVFGSYNSALITQILLIAAIAYFIFMIGRDFANSPKTGLVAAVLFLFSPFSLMVSLRFLTQTLFTFILMAAVLIWLKFLKTQNNKYFLSGIVLFSITALIRPISFLILVPIFVSLVIYRLLTRDSCFSWRKILGFIFTATIIFISILSPWLLRNYRTFGAFSLSSIKYYQMYFYDLPYIYSRAKGVTNQEADQILRQDLYEVTGSALTDEDYFRDFTHSELLKQRTFHYLAQMPGTAVLTRAELMFKFFTRDGVRYWIHYYMTDPLKGFGLIPIILERAIWFLIFIGMVAATTYGILYRNAKTANFLNVLLLLVLYFAFLTGVMASAGLRFPVEPLFLLLGLSGLSLARKNINKFIKDRAAL